MAKKTRLQKVWADFNLGNLEKKTNPNSEFHFYHLNAVLIWVSTEMSPHKRPLYRRLLLPSPFMRPLRV